MLSRVVLDVLLCDLPETWTHRNEGEGTWSPFEVVGHLIHAERIDWIPRVKIVLQFDESRIFDSFDRGGHEREIRCTGPPFSCCSPSVARSTRFRPVSRSSGSDQTSTGGRLESLRYTWEYDTAMHALFLA